MLGAFGVCVPGKSWTLLSLLLSLPVLSYVFALWVVLRSQVEVHCLLPFDALFVHDCLI